MDLGKLVVAFGIAILLTFFVNTTVSTIYKAPKLDYTACRSSSSSSLGGDCYTTVREQLCGVNRDYDCTSQVYTSQQYKDCSASQQRAATDCITKQTDKIKSYTSIYYVILAVLALISIVVGFIVIEKRSIGSGLIGGGVLIMMLAGLFAAVSAITSSLSSIMSGLAGSASGSNTGTPLISILSIIFSFIALVTLIVFAYLKLEKNPSAE